VSARAYLLLNIVQGKSEEAARILLDEVGVVAVDMLEGPPDIIVLIEASGRSTLARLTVRAIASVEALTEDIQLLPAQDVHNACLAMGHDVTKENAGHYFRASRGSGRTERRKKTRIQSPLSADD